MRSVRGTDVVGWQKSGTITGVILTEFGSSEVHASLSAIKTRIFTALATVLPSGLAENIHISFHVFPEEWNTHNSNLLVDVELHPDLPMSNRGGPLRQVLKRGFDIVFSLLTILLLSPLLLGISTIIRLTSKGPVIFRQKRVGQYGVAFTLYKFRSMQEEADATIHEMFVRKFITKQIDIDSSSEIYKLTNDPRITRFGSFLRRTSLDELPQLFNVLKGDMSLVGPRPPLFYELEVYNPWHRRRLLNSRPGITGLWQVYGRSRVRFDDMVRLDLQYAAKQSLWLDLLILAKTPWAVLTCRGAF
jgi:lipopolysaccharide/colanic/teichoic acid biosynthesis glycosyltransferase